MRVIGDVASAQVVQSGNRRRGEGVWSISICLGCGRMRDNDAINNVAKQEGQMFRVYAEIPSNMAA